MALVETLVVGGEGQPCFQVAPPVPCTQPESTRAGGKRPYGWDGHQFVYEETEEAEADGHEGATSSSSGRQWVEGRAGEGAPPSQVEETTLAEEDEEEKNPAEEAEEQEEQDVFLEIEFPEQGEEAQPEGEGSEPGFGGGQPGGNQQEGDRPFDQLNDEQLLSLLDEEQLELIAGMAERRRVGVWNGQHVNEPMNPPRARVASVGQQDLRNELRVDAERGYVWVNHVQPRTNLCTPDELPYPYTLDRFHGERFARCESFDAEGNLEVSELYDNWLVQGRAAGPFPSWTGYTMFIFSDAEVPWEHRDGPYPEDPDDPEGDDDEGDEPP